MQCPVSFHRFYPPGHLHLTRLFFVTRRPHPPPPFLRSTHAVPASLPGYVPDAGIVALSRCDRARPVVQGPSLVPDRRIVDATQVSCAPLAAAKRIRLFEGPGSLAVSFCGWSC